MSIGISANDISHLVHQPSRRRSRAAARFRDRCVRGILFACSALSVFITFTIIVVLLRESIRFFGLDGVDFSNFISGTKWSPLIGGEIGVWPLICGTLLVTGIAMLVALPLGMVTAIYLSEYASSRLRSILKPTLEVLAGVPTVVYGYFALMVITPGLKFFHEGFNIYNALSAGIAVGILCLPTVCSLAEDALRAVPRSLRDAAYGLGATRFDVSTTVVVPAALSGIVSACLLSISRAIGETMIVALAAGATARMTLDPRQEVQTMTGWIVQMCLGDASHQGMGYFSMYAVAAVLFLMTFTLTVIGSLVRNRFREEYQ
ncbi:phosphate ABC transporter permease subunit PstC [Allorhodopirellula solitaria]|uniref:Phosphate transport system permease protein n=1 Tax=Allorhodopirellula solitaria TaxID=2527987 RepID=A0A5C5YBU1_9BACT|nr:phosphate ABC transporter permease subunit PstC [Allorhodopirellula solitaria]TWT73177.1 Phosphate transport system permease protein PstA [Allorhodopirellula solitaria]